MNELLFSGVREVIFKPGNTGIYYGGYTSNYSNKVTRISASGTLIGAETTAGTARHSLAGASVNT